MFNHSIHYLHILVFYIQSGGGIFFSISSSIFKSGSLNKKLSTVASFHRLLNSGPIVQGLLYSIVH